MPAVLHRSLPTQAFNDISLTAYSRDWTIAACRSIAWTGFSGHRKIVFRVIEGIDAIERLALLDAITDLLEDLDARALVDSAPAVRARRLRRRQSIPETTPSFDAVTSSVKVPNRLTDRRALSVDDLLHPFGARTAIEKLARARVTAAATQLRTICKQMSRKSQRLFTQISVALSDHWPTRP